MLYSEHVPGNLGVIFRREFTDLRDSTIQDFEKYTGLTVDSNRNVKLPNRSTIMFRHLEELNNIQNINLGWFALEQADELDSDHEFFMLFGRLRRQVEPDEYFKMLKLPERSGWAIGNSGEHWGRALWKLKGLQNSECVEATTYDNRDVLPEDYLASLDALRLSKPEIYRQYVLNEWDVSPDQFIVIKPQWIEALLDSVAPAQGSARLVSCDPSLGGDECVIYVMEDNAIIDQRILHEDNTMIIAGEILALCQRYSTTHAAVDAIGIGKGIVDRLSEWKLNVIPINSAVKDGVPENYYNRRAEMWWYAGAQILNKNVPKPKDPELIRQLISTRYKVMDSNSKIKLESKQDTKDRLQRSPDRADAFVYGVWAYSRISKRQFDFARRDMPAVRENSYGWQNQTVGAYGW